MPTRRPPETCDPASHDALARFRYRRAAGWRHQDDYGDVERRSILLMRNVSIACQENVRVYSGQSEQLAVGFAGPPYLGASSHVVADEVAFQAPG
jgi:hypothetical protein